MRLLTAGCSPLLKCHCVAAQHWLLLCCYSAAAGGKVWLCALLNRNSGLCSRVAVQWPALLTHKTWQFTLTLLHSRSHLVGILWYLLQNYLMLCSSGNMWEESILTTKTNLNPCKTGKLIIPDCVCQSFLPLCPLTAENHMIKPGKQESLMQ